MNRGAPKQPSELGEKGFEPKSLVLRRTLWIVAFAGIAVPAIARFLSNPADGSTTVWAIIGGVALSLLLYQSLVWVIAVPSTRRARALRKTRPGCFQVEVTALSSEVANVSAMAEESAQLRPQSSTFTMTLSDQDLEFWTGSHSPRLFASIPKKSILGAQQALVNLPLRRAWGINLTASKNGAEAPIELVPMNGTGGALNANRVSQVVYELEQWRVDEGQVTAPGVVA